MGQSDDRPSDAPRYKRLLEEFFRLVDEVTPEVTIRRGPINPQTGEIKVITADGEIPIELLSQGAESLIGWTSILLRRLYDMYGDREDFRDQFALVLMDELDAHMHPLWQRTLVTNLSRLFPAVQFIATTHSPLVVGGLPIEQVIRLARDAHGQVVVMDVDPDMTMGRTDQVLTGSLFGLQSAFDETTEQILGQIQSLSANPERTPADERVLARLRQALEVRIPVPQATPAERRAQELVHLLLESQLGDAYPQVQESVEKKAEQLFAELHAEEVKRR